MSRLERLHRLSTLEPRDDQARAALARESRRRHVCEVPLAEHGPPTFEEYIRQWLVNRTEGAVIGLPQR